MANTYEDFLAQSGYTPKITAYDSSTPDISDDTFIKILNKQSTNNTPENRQRILDMWASQRARREANAKPATYESTTVETFTPFYSPRIGYAGSNISGNFTNTYGWASGGQSTPAEPKVSSATPIQDGVAKLNTNFMYGKPFFHIEKPSLQYQYTNKYNPGNGIVPFTALMQPSSNASVQSDVQEEVAQEAAPKLTFKQAFAQARKGGLSEFEWNGGKYSTALKEESKPTIINNNELLYTGVRGGTYQPSTGGGSAVSSTANKLLDAERAKRAVVDNATTSNAGSTVSSQVSNVPTVSDKTQTIGNKQNTTVTPKEVPVEQWRSYSYEKQQELRKQGYYPKGDLVQGWKNFVSGLKQYTNRRINTSIPTSYRPTIRR